MTTGNTRGVRSGSLCLNSAHSSRKASLARAGSGPRRAPGRMISSFALVIYVQRIASWRLLDLCPSAMLRLRCSRRHRATTGSPKLSGRSWQLPPSRVYALSRSTSSMRWKSRRSLSRAKSSGRNGRHTRMMPAGCIAFGRGGRARVLFILPSAIQRAR